VLGLGYLIAWAIKSLEIIKNVRVSIGGVVEKLSTVVLGFLLLGNCLADRAGVNCIIGDTIGYMEEAWSCLKTHDTAGLEDLIARGRIRIIPAGTQVARLDFETDSPPIVKVRIIGEGESYYAFKNTIIGGENDRQHDAFRGGSEDDHGLSITVSPASEQGEFITD
jgi:hypothetical protein